MELTLIPDEDPRLHMVCSPVDPVQCKEPDPEYGNWDELANRMIHFMLEKGGIGLAAPQIGIPKRLFVLGGHIKGRVCFNPEILKLKDKKTGVEFEGCLSYPNLQVTVKRPKTIKVAYQDATGKRHVRTLRNLDARAFQHELDHLNGIVIKDRLKSQLLDLGLDIPL